VGRRYRTADGRASVQAVTRDGPSPVDSVPSVYVGDGVEDAYAEAQRRGYEIVHPLTEEPGRFAGSSLAIQMATPSTS